MSQNRVRRSPQFRTIASEEKWGRGRARATEEGSRGRPPLRGPCPPGPGAGGGAELENQPPYPAARRPPCLADEGGEALRAPGAELLQSRARAHPLQELRAAAALRGRQLAGGAAAGTWEQLPHAREVELRREAGAPSGRPESHKRVTEVATRFEVDWQVHEVNVLFGKQNLK